MGSCRDIDNSIIRIHIINAKFFAMNTIVNRENEFVIQNPIFVVKNTLPECINIVK